MHDNVKLNTIMQELQSNCGPIKPVFLANPKINCAPDITHNNIPYIHQMFCKLAYQPALQFMWVLVIDAHNKDYLLGQLNTRFKELEPPGWGTNQMIKDTWTDQTQNTIGCIFAQGLTLPGETGNIEMAGITEGSKRGFINSPIMNGRADYEPMQISFLETNQSFADGVLRPWSILMMHEGLLARPQSESLKATISVYQLHRKAEDKPNIIRKAWIFKDCAPVHVSPEDLLYDTNDFGKRQTTFVYNSYSINQEQQSNCS